MTTNLERDQAAREVAERLGLHISDADGSWWDEFKNYVPVRVQNSLINSTLECRRLREALAELSDNVRASFGGMSRNLDEKLEKAQAALKAGGYVEH